MRELVVGKEVLKDPSDSGLANPQTRGNMVSRMAIGGQIKDIFFL